ncbi:hypothetical protein [Mycolicibacterium sp. D5.8-2]|uniref:hypothetical protein n=1 Tax=Mycolicibacterium sp. D5.8-2 TaxID=3085903 RepID=UPI00298C1C35|nr:hypothetical protein [Mycolicibacterium sp. D5.8-2]MDW5612084.1 hypothetical protein [Mycolicibacterium sp. D5.8-2]
MSGDQNIPDEPIEIEYRSHVRVLDQYRSAEAVRAGRHSGSERVLTAVDDHGRALVTAFQFDTYWHIDIESQAFKALGLKQLGSEVIVGFRVRTEEAAVDWLEFLARAVTR